MAGAVNTSYTFTATDVITSTKMNNIIDETVMTSDAITGSTLAVSTGKLRVNTSGITANELATDSVTTTAILDANVTTAKIADSNVTTAKIADSNVTTAKIADSNVTTSKIADANVTAAKLNGLQTGTAPIFGVRAWVSFQGGGSIGTYMTILGSGNVSSVYKDGVGNYRVFFGVSTPLPSSVAAVSGTCSNIANHPTVALSCTEVSTTYCRVLTGITGSTAAGGQLVDTGLVTVMVIG